MSSTTSSDPLTLSSHTTPRWLRPLLRIDAVGSVVIGLGLVAVAGWLASPLGLASSLPILIVAGLFILNGPLNAVAARRLSRTRLLGPIAVDALFGLVMLVVAVADPAGAQLWARWAVAVVGVLSLDLAAAKAWGRARLDV